MRPVVHHLGRAGEVPGGMTQVLNAYLAWPFDQVGVSVITTRGNPHDHRAALRHATGALLHVARLPRGRSVVVAHLSERGSFLREGALLRLARLRGLGTVAHLHGASFVQFAARHPRLVGFALGSADHVISLSDESSEVARRSAPVAAVTLVPNAVPSGAPGEKERTVVFGGVVTRRKGVDVLLEAWESLGGRTDGWRLLVAGPPREPEVMRELPGVEFLGAMQHGELMALLDRAAIAVLPSREEAMPMFILEAMARRCCVIATPVGGVAAVLDDGRGLLVPAGEAVALADGLAAALEDDQQRTRVADRALAAFHEGYAAAAVFPRVEAVWLAALADARHRRRRVRVRPA